MQGSDMDFPYDTKRTNLTRDSGDSVSCLLSCVQDIEAFVISVLYDVNTFCSSVRDCFSPYIFFST